MNTGPRISKPVLILTTAAVALTLLLVWVRLGSREQPQVEADSQPAAAAPSASAEIAPNSETAIQPAVRWEGGLPPVVPISLAGVLIEAENSQWQKSEPFLSMPRGTQNFGGIEFWLEGMIQLQCKSSKDENRSYRERIVVLLVQTNAVETGTEIVPRGSNVASVHLLGATRYGGEGERTVADLVWRYTDGGTRRTPIRFENHVRDWVHAPYEAPAYLPYAFSKVVWRAPLPNQASRTVRLYRFSYPNPEPAKVIRRLEFVSAMEVPNLFIVGLTLDPLKPGERPDDTRNLEPTDPPLPNQIEILVQTSDGVLIPTATIRAQIQQIKGKSPTRFSRSMKTDNGGVARVDYPAPADIDRLDISASHEDYGSRKMVWSPASGDIIPANYTLKLSGGVTIGGTVVDASENPIAAATIRLNRFWMGGDDMNKKGDQPDFPSQSKTTDAQGRWEAKGLASEILDRIGVDVKHPDYVGTNFTVRSASSIEQQLRAGTFKVVLRAGQDVLVAVTDDLGTPLSGATVWAGSCYTRERQDNKTDAQGRVSFRNVISGDVQFSVTAKGRKPAVKTVSVKPGMGEIVFKLDRGQVIRGLVQNEAAEPLPDTRISLESPMGGVAESYEFSATTDKDGRFEWDGAPDEPVSFYFGKTGYEQKRRQQLKPNEENIITLRKSREVRGWVLDAETEKPITKFRVAVGQFFSLDTFYADSRGTKDFSDANGAFTLSLDEEQTSAIKAEADDYAEQAQRLPKAENGVVQVIFHLKPSAALRAVLVMPDGTPVPGATVALTSGRPGPGVNVSLRNGRLTDSGRGIKIATTDASGQFVLPSPPESGMVVGTAEMGFALAPIQQVRDSGRLVLQAFGRIEGTFKIGGQPGAGQDFMFSMMNAGISLDFGTYKVTTDEAGRFSIEEVPPGEGQIVRLVKTTPNSWMHSHQTDVIVEPGKTTQITIGDSGAVLKGHVSFETPLPNDEKLTISGRLSTQMPGQPSRFQTADEARAFYDSPEWKERMKQMKNFAVSVNADGSLTLDSIPPGTYTLNVTASKAGSRPFENPPVAEGRTTVTIPEGANPYSPINLGEIVLKPIPQANFVPRP